MAFTREFFAFSTCTAMIMVFHCKADPLPPPTGLSHKWLDNFTVRMSWNKPRGLSDDNEIEFLVESTDGNSLQCVDGTNFTESFFTKKMRSDRWTYNISTVRKKCDKSSKSTPVTITIYPPKPRAELVKDFKCIICSRAMNCSWIPLSLNLTLFYRTSGRSEEDIKSLKECAEPYSSGERNGCSLRIDTEPDNIWILMQTEAAMSTFEPDLEALPPKLSIEEEGNYLSVRWEQDAAETKCWIAEICYKQCNKDMEYNCVATGTIKNFSDCSCCTQKVKCQNTSIEKRGITVPYNKDCLYEFWAKIMTIPPFTIPVSSKHSEVVLYGSNNPDWTPIVIAIVIPIVLSICVILSCYCFRRHSAIICPIIPDPSAIFKEMMMNGNKELKTTAGNLYKPVPESIDSCKITLVTENSNLKQNS